MTRSRYGILKKKCLLCRGDFNTSLRHPSQVICAKTTCKRARATQTQYRWNKIHKDRYKEIARQAARRKRNTPPSRYRNLYKKKYDLLDV